MRPWRWAIAGGLGLLLAGAVAWAQGTSSNPAPGSVWTYLGATFGAGWVFTPPSQAGISPLTYGAKGDGVTDDTTAVQQAINAAANTTLLLGPHIYKVGPLTCNAPMTILGTQSGHMLNGPAGERNDGIPSVGYSGFKARDANQVLLTLNAACAGSRFQDFFAGMSPAGAFNTFGWAIQVSYHSFGATPVNAHLTFQNLQIDFGCGGIDIGGNYWTIDHVMMTQAGGGNGCYGIRVGHNDINSATNDGIITYSRIIGTFVGARLDNGMRIEDGGGLWVTGNDINYANVGTVIKPANGQQVIYTFFNNTILGDTSQVDGFEIDTGSTDAVVHDVNCVSCWVSSSQTGAGITISNSGGTAAANFDGFSFEGLRDYNNNKEGMILNSATGDYNVVMSSPHFCGNNQNGASSPSAGIVARAGANLNITGGVIAASCDGLPTSTQVYGINFLDTTTGGHNNASIQGVSVGGNTTPIAYGIGLNGLIVNNPGFNPGFGGTLAITVPASPWTYQAGPTGEWVCLKGGTGITVSIGGQVFSSSGSPPCMFLGPMMQMTVVYATAPTAALSRL